MQFPIKSPSQICSHCPQLKLGATIDATDVRWFLGTQFSTGNPEIVKLLLKTLAYSFY